MSDTELPPACGHCQRPISDDESLSPVFAGTADDTDVKTVSVHGESSTFEFDYGETVDSDNFAYSQAIINAFSTPDVKFDFGPDTRGRIIQSGESYNMILKPSSIQCTPDMEVCEHCFDSLHDIDTPDWDRMCPFCRRVTPDDIALVPVYVGNTPSARPVNLNGPYDSLSNISTVGRQESFIDQMKDIEVVCYDLAPKWLQNSSLADVSFTKHVEQRDASVERTTISQESSDTTDSGLNRSVILISDTRQVLTVDVDIELEFSVETGDPDLRICEQCTDVFTGSV